ncbi:MAG: 16S rRNA (guanine(966)-N(2))-methyltransferase RsmD [Prochlorotrichaceae cyanobacterium]|jgi:16S rRNA (guanine966-N2)-methyltransferase
MSLRILGHRPLKTLPGSLTRPTPARVRAAVFNIWQGSLEGCRWLDLCAGSGAMGAEALCRGAQTVVGIEQSAKALRIVRENWQNLAEPHQNIQCCKGDVLTVLPKLKGQAFDRIYFDPPYQSDRYQPVLQLVQDLDLLAPQGEIAVEHDRHRQFPPPDRWTIQRDKVYGNTAVTFYGWL